MTKEHLLSISRGFINSYSQLFFSDNKIFAWLLLISSFVSPQTGFTAALCTLTAILFSWWIGLDRKYIEGGTYSFNALMLGLVSGGMYEPSIAFLLVVTCSAVLSVLLSMMCISVFYKYKIPWLSIPFLLSLWMMLTGIRSYESIELDSNALFASNSMYKTGGIYLVELMEQINNIDLPNFILVYLKSLSAILFQNNIIVGSLMLIGIVVWSRIAFLLSLLGYGIGYLFFHYLSGDFNPLLYSYIGFNFILTAIALGGFFVVPSRSSFLLVIISAPISALLISGLSGFLSFFQLPLYSLPFALTVIFFMVLLQNRFYFNRLILVSRQYFSPEKNLYSYQNGMERYKNNTYIHMGLPYYGEWYVSQGYEGNITHKEDWKYALDFVVVDEMKHTFKYPGNELTDYYCYNLPVLAPAAGYIHQCVDDIPDNAIKDVNIEQNWGNTIVIKHTEYLYSKLSHLKPGSLLVKPGEYVTKGQVLAMCGSSGRSPEPHLHFQLQSTPYIGSKTLSYPIAYYISHQAEQTQFHSFSVPDEGELISEPTITPLMSEAFKFIPGNTLIFEVTDGDQKEIVKWNCMVDAWNHTYLYCAKTNSCAYFVNNGVLHYFTEYTGDENALLYQFYLGAYKVLLCYYPSINWNDTLPVHTFYKGIAKLINDITSPFFSLLNIKYEARYTSSNDLVHPGEIAFESNISARTRQLKLGESNYRFVIKNNGIDTIEIRNKNKTIIAKCI